MKKAIIGLMAASAIIGLRPLVRGMGRKMQEHREQMPAHCKQMAAQFGGRGEPVSRA